MADNESGYGKPPKARQFGQPGGNRRGPGRQKGAKNIATIFAATAGAAVKPVGYARKISKLEAAMTQLSNKAASGDLRAIEMLIRIATALETRAEQDKEPTLVLSNADRQLIRMMAERVQDQLIEVDDE